MTLKTAYLIGSPLPYTDFCNELITTTQISDILKTTEHTLNDASSLKTNSCTIVIFGLSTTLHVILRS